MDINTTAITIMLAPAIINGFNESFFLGFICCWGGTFICSGATPLKTPVGGGVLGTVAVFTAVPHLVQNRASSASLFPHFVQNIILSLKQIYYS
jgi:hypothetical protein